MKKMRILEAGRLRWPFLDAGCCAGSRPRRRAGAMPDGLAGQPGAGLPAAMQEAEPAFELGQQAARRQALARRPAPAGRGRQRLPEHRRRLPGGGGPGQPAGRPGHRAAQAGRGGVEPPERMPPRLDKALDLEVKVAAARGDKGDPAQLERLLADAENVWREAADCASRPTRRRPRRASPPRVRARRPTPVLSAAPPATPPGRAPPRWAITPARPGGTSAGTTPRCSTARPCWPGKGAPTSAPAAARPRPCARSSRPRSTPTTPNTGPPVGSATDQSQQLRTAGPAVSATEKDALSVRAEAAWRDAVIQCRGNPQSLARTNADAIARERAPRCPRTPWPSYGSRKAPPPAIVTNQPVATPVVAAPAQALAAAAPGVKPPVAMPAPATAPAATAAPAPAATPAPAAAAAPAAPPGEVVLVAGDTTYRGAFALDRQSGAVSGTGTVEWTNGERYVGTLVNGRKHGKGRFEWVGRPVVRRRLGGGSGGRLRGDPLCRAATATKGR